MKQLLKYKKIIMILAIAISAIILYATISFDKEQPTNENIILNGDNSSDININSIELKADLEKLTNIKGLDDLKNSMSGYSESEITDEALNKGIVVKQGIMIDIDKLFNLNSQNTDKSNLEIINDAASKKIIRLFGDSKVTSINISELKSLKDMYNLENDEEIVRRALKKEIIKGEFNYSDLKIDTDLDLNGIDVSQFGDYNPNECWRLEDLKNSSIINNNKIEDVGIKSGKIEAQYKIDLLKNPISQGDENKIPMDVAIIIDTATDKNSYLANALNNHVFNNSALVNNLPTDVNFIVIPYHIDSQRQNYLYYYNQCNHNNYRDDLQQMINKLKDDGGKQINFSDTIDRALRDSKTWFDSKDEKRIKEGKNITSSKAILLLTTEILNEEYAKCFQTSNGEEKFILDDRYNAITIFNSEYGYGDNLNNLSKPYASNIKKLHDEVGGADSTFYVSYTEKPGQETHNDINSVEKALDGRCIAEKVADDLLDSQYSRYVTTTANLNLNFGQNIRMCSDDTNNAETSINSNDEQKIKIKLSKIRLKTDYSILGDRNITITDGFIDDLTDNIIENTRQSKIDNEEVARYLQERLSDLKIQIDKSDAEIITDGMFENILNRTIQDINADKNYVICKQSNDGSYISGIISSESYNLIKNTKGVEILSKNLEIENNKWYLKIRNLLREMIQENISIKINNALTEKIGEKYDAHINEKNEIINGILNNTDVASIVKNITKKPDSEVANIIAEIKKIFNSYTRPSDIYLSLSTTTISTLKQNGRYDTTLKYILSENFAEDSPMKVAQIEIRNLLQQKLNVPLRLTQTTYVISNEDSKVEFKIEPTLKSVFDESLNELAFVDNINEDNPDNNYIEYRSNNSNSTIIKKTSIKDTPILKINRSIISKDNIVYEKLEDIVNYNGEPVKKAKSLGNSDSYNFAKDSVITFASNIMNMSGQKTIYLNIDCSSSTEGDGTALESNSSEVEIEQSPKIYKYNYETNQLDLICNMQKEENSNRYKATVSEENKTNLIILYSVKADKSYKNEIKISGVSIGSGTINVNMNNRLPDLF